MDVGCMVLLRFKQWPTFIFNQTMDPFGLGLFFVENHPIYNHMSPQQVAHAHRFI